MLLRKKEDQEAVSREKKDRRDFEHIATLASRMGLYRYFLLNMWFSSFFLFSTLVVS